MIKNLTQNQCVAKHPFYAQTPWQLLRGLLGRYFTTFDAMVLMRCRAVHTCFMSKKIDLIFLDAEHVIVFIKSDVLPWTFCVRHCKSVTVIELPEGSLKNLEIKVGDVLSLDNDVSMKAIELEVNKIENI